MVFASSVTYLSLPPLFLWFEHTMSFVSILATALTHTLFIFMAKQVQRLVVLRTGSWFYCREFGVYVAMFRPTVWQDVQVDGH